jgi:hypothetical protein
MSAILNCRMPVRKFASKRTDREHFREQGLESMEIQEAALPKENGRGKEKICKRTQCHSIICSISENRRPWNEREITKETFDLLWKRVRPKRRIYKTRYFLDLAIREEAWIDFIHEKDDDVVEITVAFSTPEQAQAFVPPSWFGEEMRR